MPADLNYLLQARRNRFANPAGGSRASSSEDPRKAVEEEAFQAETKRLAAAAKEQAAASEDAVKAYDKGRKEAEKEAQRARNNEMEAKARREKRPIYTDADGVIQSQYTDDEWEAKKKLKAKNDQLRTQYFKENRPWVEDAEGNMIPRHTDEQWKTLQAEKAAKEKAKLLDEQAKDWREQKGAALTNVDDQTEQVMRGLDLEGQDLTLQHKAKLDTVRKANAQIKKLQSEIDSQTTETDQPLDAAAIAKRTAARDALVAERDKVQAETDAAEAKLRAHEVRKLEYSRANNEVQGWLQKQKHGLKTEMPPVVMGVKGSGGVPTEGTEQTKRVETDQSQSPLKTGAPSTEEAKAEAVRKAVIEGRISALAEDDSLSDEERKAGLTRLMLQRDDLKAYEAQVMQEFEKLPPEKLSETLDGHVQDFEKRKVDWQARRDALRQQTDAVNAEVDNVLARNAQRLQQPHTAADLVTYTTADGGKVSVFKDMVPQLEQAQEKAGTFEKQHQAEMDQIKAEGGELERAAKLIHAGGGVLQKKQDTAQVAAKAERQQVYNQLNAIPGAKLGDELAKVDDAVAKHQGGDDVSLHEWAKQEREKILERAKVMPEQAQKFYQEWAKGMDYDWSAEHPDPGFTGVETNMEAEAKKYGIMDKKGARYWLTTMAQADWSRPNKIGGKEIDPAKQDVRFLPNGNITVNPAYLLDKEGYEQVVKDSQATPEAKKQALEVRQEIAPELATQALEALRQNSDMADWLRKHTHGSDLERMEQFTAYQKAEGWSQAALMRFQAAAAGIGASWMGAAGAVTGSDTFLQADVPSILSADWWKKRAEVFSTAAGVAEKGTGVLGKYAAMAVGGLPSVLESVAAGMLTGGAASLARAGKLAKVLSAATKAKNFKQGQAAINAFNKGIQTVSVAGAAIDAGIQQGGSTFNDAYQHYLEQELGKLGGEEMKDPTAEEIDQAKAEARKQALKPALLDALQTAGLTALGGAKGAEALLRTGADAAVKKAFKTGLGKVLAGIGMDAGEEFLEEYANQFVSGVIAQASYNPKLTVKEVFSQALDAGIVGGLLGGGMGTVKAVGEYRAESKLEGLPQGGAKPEPEKRTETTQGTEGTPEGGAGVSETVPTEKAAEGGGPVVTPAEAAGAEAVNPEPDQSQLKTGAPSTEPEKPTVEEARAELASFAPEGMAPHQIEATKAKAEVLLRMAQGDTMQDFTDEELRTVGLNRDGTPGHYETVPVDKKDPQAGRTSVWKKGVRPDGFQPVVVEDGQLIITQRQVDNLKKRLPTVAAQIGKSEVERRREIAEKTLNAERSTANIESQKNVGSQPPARAKAFDPAMEQRVDEIATELSSRGLSGEQALKAARGVVQRMGVQGPKYEVQMIDPAFEEAMKAEGFQRDPAKMSRWIVKGQFKAETQAEKAARREKAVPEEKTPESQSQSQNAAGKSARITPLIERSDWKQAQGEVIAAMQARAKGLPEAAKKAASDKIKAVVKRFNKLEDLIDTKFGRLFEGVRIVPNGSQSGGGLAAQVTGYDAQGRATGVELLVDAATFAENGGITDAELERALNEEWQHRADLMVMSRREAIDLAKSIHAAQPGVFNAAWKQYFAVGIKEGSVPAKPPVELTDDEAYMLYFEASRMIRQGTFTSENAAIRDVGLLQRMYLWLSRYVNFVQREMKKLPQDLRELWEDKLTAAEAVMGKTKQAGIRLQKAHLDDVEPPEGVPQKGSKSRKKEAADEDEEALAMAADAEMDTRPERKGALRNPGENAIRGMSSIPDPDTGKENVVVWINRYHGRITRPSKGWLARMAQEGKDRSKIGDWDDIQQAGIPSFYSALVFKNGNGSTLDQALQELHGMGYFPGVDAENVTGEMLASKILDVIQRYQAKKQGGATTVQDEEQAHFERMEAQRVEFERSTATGPIFVKPHEMQPGDVMMVKADDGKMHRVEVLRLDTEPVPAGEEFDPDANPAQFMGPDGPMQIQSVTLRDGTTFGVQTIDGQQGLFVDAFSVRQEGDFYAGLSDAVQNRSIDDADAVLRVMQHEGMDATTPFSQIVLAIQQNLRVPMRRAQKMLAQVMDTDANATVWTNEELKMALESPLNAPRKQSGPGLFGEDEMNFLGDRNTLGLGERGTLNNKRSTLNIEGQKQSGGALTDKGFSLEATTPEELKAEAERRELREKLQQRAEKPLVGTMGDIGQMDMLGGGDLFAQPKKTTDTQKQDAPATSGSLEPDRPRDTAGDIGRTRGLQPAAPAAGDNAEPVGPEGAGGQDTRVGGDSPAGSDATAGGTAGAEPVQGQAPRVSGSPARGEQPAGGGAIDEPRAAVESGAELDLPPVAPERPAVDTVAAERRPSLESRVVDQAKAQNDSSIWDGFKVADADSIKKSLPMLLPQQQDDVLKAERRFFVQEPSETDPRKGVLFTNGTGTGKTFTGLGIIKRFEMMGKGRVLIVVPSQQKVTDWKNEGARVMVKVNPLKDTNDVGEDVVATTYANLRDNWRLQSEPWDLVVYDESHYLSSNAQGNEGANVRAHELATNKPGMSQMEKWTQAVLGPRPSYREDEAAAKRYDNAAEQASKQIQYLADTAPDTKAVFLSATPFAYHKNLKYADGFLYTAPEHTGSSAYNTPQGFDRYLVENFGYTMRTNRLNSPPPEVDTGLMEREWAERQFQQGSMSGRMIDVPYDYSREFVLLNSETGRLLDEGFRSLSGWDQADRERWPELTKAFNGYWRSSSSGYTKMMQFMESIKVADAIERMQQHLDLGRKIVLFHSYNNADPLHPFQLGYLAPAFRNDPAEQIGERQLLEQQARDWMAAHPKLVQMNFKRLQNPRALVAQEFGDRVKFFNGEVPKKDRAAAITLFNDDSSGVDIFMVQTDAGKEGISLHDTTGKKQRVLMNASLPVKPTDAIQEEGRIYRIGVLSNAIQEYLVLHTNMERSAFGSKISQRTGTVENMALGQMARTLTDSFKSGYLNAHGEDPSQEQGLGGKAQDKAELLGDDFTRAKSYYFGRMKKTSRNKAAEGQDYFATPEPLGLVMVRMLGAKPGMDLLEPSAGHGAIGRWFPDTTANKFIEPSRTLADELRIKVAAGKVEVQPFEDLHIMNKFDGVAMNPPFGTSGKLAMEHLAKASRHLRQGGRMVAIIPEGPAMEKRFNAWLEGEGADMHLRASYGLPTVTFERAGTSVKTRLVVLDKADLWHLENKDGVYAAYDSFGTKRTAFSSSEKSVRDMAAVNHEFIGWQNEANFQNRTPREIQAEDVKEFFDEIENLEAPARIVKTVATGAISAPAPAAVPVQVPSLAPAAPMSPLAIANASPYDVAQTLHAKKGVMTYVAKMNRRLSDAIYQSEKNRARKFGGYYSAFKGNGAIPGFQFESAEKRDEFVSGYAESGALSSPRKQGAAKTEKEVFDHRLAVAKAEIEQDMRDGVVPTGVKSFVDLQDYVDANEYVNDKERTDRMIGPLGKALGWRAQQYVNFTNGLIEALDAWLAAGSAGKSAHITIDEAAHEAATSPRNDRPEPTEAQKEAGNYAMGHAVIGGHEISIENPAGSKRRPEWPVLKDHYGYLKGTKGQDGDHVDVFVKPGTPADYAGPVHVVRQNVVEGATSNTERSTLNIEGRKPELKATGKLDEYKVMMGYPMAEEARAAYLRNYTKGWPGLAKLTTHTMPEFEVIKRSVFGGESGARATDKALASARKQGQGGGMADPDKAAQYADPSPGGLSEADGQYFDALQRRDAIAAQKLVAQAAKFAGFTKKLFTGQARGLNVLPKVMRNELPKAYAFLTNDRDVAAHYSGAQTRAGDNRDMANGRKGKTYKVFVKLNNTLDLDESPNEEWWIENLAMAGRVDSILDEMLYLASDEKLKKLAAEYKIPIVDEDGEEIADRYIRNDLASAMAENPKSKWFKKAKLRAAMQELGFEWDDELQSFKDDEGNEADGFHEAIDQAWANIHNQGWYLQDALSKSPMGKLLSLVPEEVVEKFLEENGYDSYSHTDAEIGGTTYIIFDPSQAKSADLITFSDARKIIPLSHRFDSGDDLRGDVEWQQKSPVAEASLSENSEGQKTSFNGAATGMLDSAQLNKPVNPESSRAEGGTPSTAEATEDRLGAPRKQGKALEMMAKADWGRIDKALTGRLATAVTDAAAWIKKQALPGEAQVNPIDAALEMLAGWSVAGQMEASGATFKPAQKQDLMDQTRRQLRRVWNMAVRQLVPDASLPADVLAKKREMTMNQALSNEVALDIGKRALAGKPKLSDLVVGEEQQNPEIRRKMFLAMNPKIDSGVTMASLNPEERRVAEALLKLRDDLGKRMVKAGRIGLQTYETMREGTSHYYDHDVKKEKNLLRQMSLGLRNLFAQTATAFHIVDTQTKQPDGSPALVMHPGSRNRPTYRFDTQEQMRAWYEEFIKDQILQAAEKGNAARYPWMTPADKAALMGVTRDSLNNPGRMSAEQRAVVSRLQEQLRQRFEKRVPLSYDEHSKAGLIEDPFYSVARQIAEMGHDVATAEFFNYIAGVPDYVRDAPTIGYTELPDTAKLGSLAGKYVRDDVAAEVQQLTELPGLGMKFYDALLGLFKTGKTVLNPGSHGRNIVGNIAFAHLAGSNPLNPGNAVYYADALRVLRDGGEDYREMYENGVLGGDFLTGEVKRSLRQLVPDAATVLRDAESGNLTWLYGLKEHMARRWQGLIKKPGQGLELAATAWRLEDDIYKAAAYLKAKSMGMDSTQAAEHVREWFPYYDKGTSGTLKALGRFAFPFLSFKRESFRILKNGLMKKPLATIATLALPRLLTQIALTMGEMRLLMWGLGLGLKDERDKEDVLKALKGRAGRLLSPIAGDSSLFSILLPWRDGNGGLQQWDLSNTHPFGDWLATRTEDAESKEPWITRQAREMVSGSPFLGLLVESAFNKDSFTGRRIYEDDMSSGEAQGKLLEHAYTELAPPIAPTIPLPGGVKLEGTSARTIRKAFEQSPSKLAPARNPTQAMIRTLVGLDVRPADPNLYEDVAKYREKNKLPAVPRGQQFPSDAVGRARAELYRLLIQPEVDVPAVKAQLDVLAKHGAKIPSVQDLFKDRQPQDVMKLKKHQARWMNQLAPEARRVLEAAQKQQSGAKAGALDAMVKARAGG